MRSRRTPIPMAILLVSTLGCDVPRFQGPEIQEPPPNFQRQPDTRARQELFPEHRPSFHTAWVHTDLGGVSIISIDGYPAPFTLDDVMAAREVAEASQTDPDAIFEEVEALRIDGRDGWGWYERIESNRRGREEVRYTAIVPYDSVSYSIEFVSGEPTIKRAAPDTLREVVQTFEIGQTTYNIPLIAIVLGGILLSVSMLRARSRKRADRLRSINLVTIKRESEEEAPAADAGEGGGGLPHAPDEGTETPDSGGR